MDRRQLLRNTLTTAGAIAAGSAMVLPQNATAASPTTLIDTLGKCIATGLSCAHHCDQMLAKGDKQMALCRASVSEMLATCEALQRLAAQQSKHVPELAKLAATICADCAKACEPHAAQMATCKACMEACQDCAKACRSAA